VCAETLNGRGILIIPKTGVPRRSREAGKKIGSVLPLTRYMRQELADPSPQRARRCCLYHNGHGVQPEVIVGVDRIMKP